MVIVSVWRPSLSALNRLPLGATTLVQVRLIQARMNESLQQLMHGSPKSVLTAFVQEFQSGWEELKAGSWAAIQAEKISDEELYGTIERAHKNLLSLESLSLECVANHLDIDSHELDILMTITHDLLVPIRTAKGLCEILITKEKAPDEPKVLQWLRQHLNGIDKIVKNLHAVFG